MKLNDICERLIEQIAEDERAAEILEKLTDRIIQRCGWGRSEDYYDTWER